MRLMKPAVGSELFFLEILAAAVERAGGEQADDQAQAEHDAKRLVRMAADDFVGGFRATDGFAFKFARADFQQLFAIVNHCFDVFHELLNIDRVPVS